MADAFTFELSKDGVGTLWIDLPGEKVNKLTTDVMLQLDKHLTSFSGYSALKVLLIRSKKPGIFIAGADIKEIEDIVDGESGEKKATMGQGILNKLAALPFPTVAVIDGACLGGGLELALACHFRVASDSARTQLGLPEVNLGIIPGFGGTQRLPRLIGLQKGLPMILSGKIVDAKKAKRIGLVDAYFSEAFFDERLEIFSQSLLSIERCEALIKKRQRFKGMLNWLLEGNILGRMLVFSQAKKSVLKKSKGQYPAPLAALKAIRYGYDRVLQKGLRKEAELFSQLVASDVSKNLIQLFYIQEALKKDPGVSDPSTPVKRIHRSAVLGAGLMGGGIAWLLSYRVAFVRMKDISLEAIQKGFEAARDIYGQLVKIRKVKRAMLPMYMHRLSGGLTYDGFKQMDLVVEAIVEDMGIKKAVLTELEAEVSESTIIASNTSGLSISEIASVLKHPERFVGMHFFSPVNRMPLVEVIRGEATSDETVATIVALAKQMKKTPIVVQNCAGFLVNRILIPYVNEAVKLLEDGARIQMVDRSATRFGMPLGPFALADEVGLDVGFKVAKQLEEAYGDRMSVAPTFKAIMSVDGCLGKKTGQGFFVHDAKKKRVNPAVLEILERNEAPVPSAADIEDRLFLVMLNEAARCLEEGIVASPRYLDMAMILGCGFPPFRGGLCRYADARGLSEIVDRLNALAERYGDRFKPAPLLLDMAAASRSFY